MRDIFHSLCPVVRPGPDRIARRIDVSGGFGHYQVVTFSEAVVWLRESTSAVYVRTAESERQIGSVHSDYYGFLTSPADHLAAFAAIMRREDIYPEGQRELVVATTIADKAVIADRTAEAFGERRPYRPVPHDWMDAADPGLEAYLAATPGARADLPSPYLDRQEPRIVILASSRWSATEMTARRSAALDAATADLPDAIAAAARARLTAAYAEAG